MIPFNKMVWLFQKEFEKKILELGYFFLYEQEGLCVLYDNTKNTHLITSRLLVSQRTNKLIHGSKNGIDIQSIGLFELIFPTNVKEPDFIIFTFRNKLRNLSEYVIVPELELKRRLRRSSIDKNRQKLLEVKFWLMPDNSIYDVTNISPEGEWYLLSQGVGGRMADGTDMDYTAFLNSWERLKL